jgi:hypothetical protein
MLIAAKKVVKPAFIVIPPSWQAILGRQSFYPSLQARNFQAFFEAYEK